MKAKPTTVPRSLDDFKRACSIEPPGAPFAHAAATRAVWIEYANASGDHRTALGRALQLLGEQLDKPRCTCGTGNHVHMPGCLLEQSREYHTCCGNKLCFGQRCPDCRTTRADR